MENQPNESDMTKILRGIDDALNRFCCGVLVVSICTMLGLSLLNILLRWMGMTWLWVEPFARHLVFLCAFLGATIAVGNGQHINIDLLGRALDHLGGKTSKVWVGVLNDFASFAVCGVLAYAGYGFAKMELGAGTRTFLEIPTWVLVSLIPIGTILISFRFFCRVFFRLRGEI